MIQSANNKSTGQWLLLQLDLPIFNKQDQTLSKQEKNQFTLQERLTNQSVTLLVLMKNERYAVKSHLKRWIHRNQISSYKRRQILSIWWEEWNHPNLNNKNRSQLKKLIQKVKCYQKFYQEQFSQKFLHKKWLSVLIARGTLRLPLQKDTFQSARIQKQDQSLHQQRLRLHKNKRKGDLSIWL